ncbi:MAG: DEAD/DEAH box helicase family protein, partial [Lentisphaeria bacterium]|nr:DEAD/DEAH box helicase family protein [Lentisphaeria bacterium]
MDKRFELKSDFESAGDQEQAIRKLTESIRSGDRYQTLHGVTGSGKTFTMAKIIENLQRPTLILSHNKTLAAQLYSEFKHFFPDNAVDFFISYYDYYLPEAYIPQTDTFIDKDSHINEEIEKLRLAATSSLSERRDVIIVASVSCIYGLGDPKDFRSLSVTVECGEEMSRNEFVRALIYLHYNRNDIAPKRGEFRVSGDTVDVFLAYEDSVLRVEFWGDDVEQITKRDTLTLELEMELKKSTVFPASHFAMPEERVKSAEEAILSELAEQVKVFEKQGRLVEAQRIYQRTMYDIEMMRELGFCNGIENYSRHLAKRDAGSRPWTLLDYFDEDWLLMVDESHVTLSQVRAMYKADQSRK